MGADDKVSKRDGEHGPLETPADTMTAGKPLKPFSPSSHHAPKKSFGPWELTHAEQPHHFFHRPPKDPSQVPSHMPQNPVNLQLHLGSERRRTMGMTPEEEEWRKKWILDQKLHPDEPVYVEGVAYHINPIRRVYRLPWDMVEQKVLIPTMGLFWGHAFRAVVPKVILGLMATFCAYSYVKYNRPHWTDRIRASHYLPRSYILDEARIEAEHPGLMDKAFPMPKEPKDFYHLNFWRRTTHLEDKPPTRPW